MNCIIVDDDLLSQAVLKNYVEETGFLKLTTICSSAIEAFKWLSKEKVDLIFLDIEMPDMSGLDLVKTIDPLPYIIFTTGNKEYAIEAFEYNVADYIVKPVSYTRFLKAVKKVQAIRNNEELQSTTKSDDLYIKVDSSLMKISSKEIMWVTALGDYVTINTVSKSYTVYSTLKGIEDKLPSKDFIRIHRSYIVRIDKITAIDDYIVMIGQKDIPVSKTYKAELMKRLNLV